FFQAEDGIRDKLVTGVQTCALPIFPMRPGPPPGAIYDEAAARLAAVLDRGDDIAFLCQGDPLFYGSFAGIMIRLVPRYSVTVVRSEERRVGKGWRCRWVRGEDMGRW